MTSQLVVADSKENSVRFAACGGAFPKWHYCMYMHLAVRSSQYKNRLVGTRRLPRKVKRPPVRSVQYK